MPRTGTSLFIQFGHIFISLVLHSTCNFQTPTFYQTLFWVWGNKNRRDRVLALDGALALMQGFPNSSVHNIHVVVLLRRRFLNPNLKFWDSGSREGQINVQWSSKCGLVCLLAQGYACSKFGLVSYSLPGGINCILTRWKE